MTENRENMSIKYAVCVLETIGNGLTLSNENDREDACVLAIQALDEIQQIKEIISSFPLDCGSTVEDIREIYRQLRGFLRIGTIEEFKALKEKNVAKKVIEHKKPYSVHWQCGNHIDCTIFKR